VAARLKKVITSFHFIRDQNIAGNIELDSDMTLERDDRMTLRPDPLTGLYPLTADLKTKHRLFVPNKAKSWGLFFADFTNKQDFFNNVVTTVQFRLSTDGVNELYWDGGAWSAAGAGQWSSEQEVNDNLDQLAFTGQIQVIVNLETTDAEFTPELREVKLMYESSVEYQEDYLRSLIQEVRANVRPIADYRVKMDGVASTVNLTPGGSSGGEIETPYNIEDADSAYNLTSDPNRFTDILSSYDTGTKVATLTVTPAADDIVEVRFLYEPEIVLTTSQDYTELSKVPVVVIDDIVFTTSYQINPPRSIFDKVTAQGWKLEDGFQSDIDIPMRMITDKAVDQQRLSDELKRFFANTPLLTAKGLDEKFTLDLLDEYDQQTFPTDDELHTGRLRARLYKALFFPSDAKPVTGTLTFSISGGNLQITL
jgi:hypothetical protein